MRSHLDHLKTKLLQTPLGPMLAIGDDKALYFLDFLERKSFANQIEKLKRQTNLPILPGSSLPLASIEDELKLFFSGKLKEFKTPIAYTGLPFQIRVWQELKKIPAGTTSSYQALALNIGNTKACRAVARANSTNKLAIIIPCHRVINSDGGLGGYAGGVNRKEWLIQHEKTLLW